MELSNAIRYFCEGESGLEYEEDYLIRQEKDNKKYCLMDQKLIRVTGDKFEFCDLFSINKDILHFKHRGASSTLSHLFQQGLTSADYFSDPDDSFRKEVISVMKKNNYDNFWKKIELSNFAASNYKVGFCIIDTMDISNWPLSLPFFSLVALRQAHKNLKGRGYKVSLIRIGVERQDVNEINFHSALHKRNRKVKKSTSKKATKT